MRKPDILIGGGLVAAIVAVAALAILPSGNKGTSAEWAGAIGTVAAVFAALWTASHAIRFERERNDARARVCGYFLAPCIIRINNRAESATAYAAESNYGFSKASEPNFDIEVMRKIGIFESIPGEIFADAWALPPKLAKDTINLDAYVRQYQALVESQVPRLRLMDGAERAKYTGAMEISLRNVKGVSRSVRTAIEELLGESLG